MIGNNSLLTDDTLFDGNLICRQYKQGYRFSIDSVLLAHFSRPLATNHVLDLGCGCGVISLILAYRYHELKIIGLELQPELALLAHENVAANKMESRISVIEGDLRKIDETVSPESFDLVICNPPYRHPGTGRISPTDQRARARHEIDSQLDDIIGAAAFAVKNRGRACFVYPAKRTMSLIHSLKNKKLEPKTFQPVYSYPDSKEASLVLVEAIKNGGEEVQILSPLYIYTKKNGPYSGQVQEYYN